MTVTVSQATYDYLVAKKQEYADQITSAQSTIDFTTDLITYDTQQITDIDAILDDLEVGI